MKLIMDLDTDSKEKELYGTFDRTIPLEYDFTNNSARPDEYILDISNSRKRRRSDSPTFTVLQNMCIEDGVSLNEISNCATPQNNFSTRRTEQRSMPLIKKVRTIDKKEFHTMGKQIAMISDLDGDRPIHVAVAQENLSLVQKLCIFMLKAAISLDITNYLRQTPLHLAVMLKNSKLTNLLLKYGASVTLRDRNGNSVLHLAVKSGSREEIMNLILSRPHARDILDILDYEGYSAMHYAIFKNNATAVRCLYREGAKMNILDGKSGRSPLVHAILDKNTEMVSLLLECGVSTGVLDYAGRSPFEFALHTSNKRIAQLLEKKMLAVENETTPAEEHSRKIDDSASNRILTRSTRRASKKGTVFGS